MIMIPGVWRHYTGNNDTRAVGHKSETDTEEGVETRAQCKGEQEEKDEDAGAGNADLAEEKLELQQHLRVEQRRETKPDCSADQKEERNIMRQPRHVPVGIPNAGMDVAIHDIIEHSLTEINFDKEILLQI
ncbi:hypothetical protein NDU88_003490 [Pleurodeles waltl]|uniref:Uncharacterized protein n=1 Tax=Pleurodeles waltl TaxID=8319 RepID=A0AAV7VEB6_PLEWA|nr:hypothetical protein NDU88_003490 [Pleurodeles waltl]